MIVVDANAVVMALSSPHAQGDTARAAMFGDDDIWCAPAHMPFEVLRALRNATLEGRLTATAADAALRVFAAMEFEYVGTDTSLLHFMWAMRHNISTHDAAYLAVAATHDATLLTFDARLAKAAEQTQPAIRVIAL